MSAETLQAVEDAIRAHVADVAPGEIVTEWITGYATFEPSEGEYAVGTARSNQTAPHSALGLASITASMIEDDVLDQALTSGSDDD